MTRTLKLNIKDTCTKCPYCHYIEDNIGYDGYDADAKYECFHPKTNERKITDASDVRMHPIMLKRALESQPTFWTGSPSPPPHPLTIPDWCPLPVKK